MSNLEQALIDSGQAVDEKDANEIVRAMVQRTKSSFEDPEDILYEYFPNGEYELSWTEDILNWKQYKPSGSDESSSKSGLEGKDETKMMFKIKALLDKAESTDSQAEKDAFMMKAQELIQKHNLDSQRVMAVMGGRDSAGNMEENIIEEIVKYEEQWDRDLMQNLSECNMCRVLFTPYLSQIHIIGKETNVNSVVYLCNFYRKAILNLSIEAAKRKTRLSKTLLGGKIKPKDLARIEKEEVENIKDYLFGAVDGLKYAMEKKVEVFSAETFSLGDGGGSISGKEVMRVNRDRIQEYIQSKYPRLGHFSGSRAGGNQESSSYSRGFADGGGLWSGQKRLG